jgi:hypothetical protein
MPDDSVDDLGDCVDVIGYRFELEDVPEGILEPSLAVDERDIAPGRLRDLLDLGLPVWCDPDSDEPQVEDDSSDQRPEAALDDCHGSLSQPSDPAVTTTIRFETSGRFGNRARSLKSPVASTTGPARFESPSGRTSASAATMRTSVPLSEGNQQITGL